MDAAAGTHIWADRYDRVLEDIFDLQDEISQTIAARIQPEMEHAERERAQRKSTNDLGAWDLYHRGMWSLYRFTRKDSNVARTCFRAAIDADPDFGAPYAGLAYQLCYDVWNEAVEDRTKTIQEAEQLARKSIELDERDVRSRFIYGRVLSVKCEYSRAIREFRSGLELNPSFAQMHHGMGFAMAFSGNAQEALPYFDNAIRLSPRDPQLSSFFFVRSFAHLALGEFEKALESAESAVVRPNVMPWAYVYLISAMGHLNDPRASAVMKDLEKLGVGLTSQNQWRRKFLTYFQCDPYLEQVMEGLRLAGMPE
jgi:tetratricopeptide (TPR) repeat protein